MKMDRDELKDLFLNELIRLVQRLIIHDTNAARREGLPGVPHEIEMLEDIISVGKVLGFVDETIYFDNINMMILRTPLDEEIDTIREQEYRRGYFDGFEEGYENVLSYHATRKQMDNLCDRIMDWRYGDCSICEDPPKLIKSNKQGGENERGYG